VQTVEETFNGGRVHINSQEMVRRPSKQPDVIRDHEFAFCNFLGLNGDRSLLELKFLEAEAYDETQFEHSFL
jgi:hypothetical protein